MNEVLFVAGSLTDLRRIAPLHAALQRAGAVVRLHWYGSAPTAVPDGLPTPDHSVPPQGGAVPAFAAAAAAKFAEAPPGVCVVVGEGPAAMAAVLAASSAGVPLARLDAGRRSHRRGDPREASRRAVDHACGLWLCATDRQQLDLVREGLPLDSIHTTGSLLGQTLPTNGAARQEIAFEVGGGGGKHAGATGSTTLRAALAPVAAAGGMQLVDLAGDLAALAGAAAVVTDDPATVEAACLLQVPAVFASEFHIHPEAVDAGCVQVAGPAADDVTRALAIATKGQRRWQSPYPATEAARLADAILAFLERARPQAAATTPAASAGTGPIALPSDGDASGRTLGSEEIELAARAIRSGTLNSTKGTFVTRFEQAFAKTTGRKHAIACASGSAAVHCAINALALQAGDEVITTPITDMGALTCILYEGCVPVFCDVDPRTLNVTAETIAAQITDRTRAIVVTHLFGLSCDMAPIVQLGKERGIPIIEDMAQAFGATAGGGNPGSFGAVSCYSLQQGKHMTTGEGGVVTTDDPELARRIFLFVNKAWGYGDPQPDHYFPALNFRLTELQGAVALGQLGKLDWVVARRRAVAAGLTAGLAGVPGLTLPTNPQGGEHSWWKYAFLVDPAVVEGGAVQLGKRMKERGVFCVPRYIQKPAFECKLFLDFAASPVSLLPLEHSARRDRPQPLFHRKDYPGTVRALERVIVLPINELYTTAHIDYVTAVIREEAKVLAHA